MPSFNDPEFDVALGKFVSGSQQLIDDHFARNHFKNTPFLTTEVGSRYIKIVRNEQNATGGSVHCFVDKNNGDVLKAASWRAPAKGARSNIFNEFNGVDGMTEYGAKYNR